MGALLNRAPEIRFSEGRRRHDPTKTVGRPAPAIQEREEYRPMQGVHQEAFDELSSESTAAESITEQHFEDNRHKQTVHHGKHTQEHFRQPVSYSIM